MKTALFNRVIRQYSLKKLNEAYAEIYDHRTPGTGPEEIPGPGIFKTEREYLTVYQSCSNESASRYEEHWTLIITDFDPRQDLMVLATLPFLELE